MRFTGLLVALLSIKLEYRGKDVGTALIGEDFECAVQKGYKAAFLYRNMEYYKKFGFNETSCHGIANKTELHDKFI